MMPEAFLPISGTRRRSLKRSQWITALTALRLRTDRRVIKRTGVRGRGNRSAPGEDHGSLDVSAAREPVNYDVLPDTKDADCILYNDRKENQSEMKTVDGSLSFIRLMQETEKIPRRRPYRSICGDFLRIIPGGGNRETPGAINTKERQKTAP